MLFNLLPALLIPGVLSAPIRLPAPLTHPRHASRGLLGGLNLPIVDNVPVLGDSQLGTHSAPDIVSDLPVVGALVDGLGLDGVVDTVLNLPVVGDVVDTALGLLDPLVGVALGVKLDLEVDAFLTCGLVSGLFGGRNYDLGCTCLGDLGLLLEVDIDAVVNVAGLDAWVEAQVGLGLGVLYPRGALPTCDGTGGWTCPSGNCGAPCPSSALPSIRTAKSTLRSSTSASPTFSATPTVSVSITATLPPASSIVINEVSYSPTPAPTSSAPTSSPLPSTFSAHPQQPTPEEEVIEEEVEDCDEDEDEDEDVNTNGGGNNPSSYGGYTPTQSVPSTQTAQTVYIVETPITVTATVTSYVTPTATATATVTVHDGECFSEAAVSSLPASSPAWTSSAPSTWSSVTSSATPTSAAHSSSVSSTTLPSTISNKAQPPASSVRPSPLPSHSAVPVPVVCPTGKRFDINVNLCVDVCLGVLNLLGVCVETDLGTGINLPIL